MLLYDSLHFVVSDIQLLADGCHMHGCGVLIFCGTLTPGFKKIGTPTPALKNPQTPTPIPG